MTLIVGVTGGIGCGKTTVTDYLAARGAAIVDTDAIAHQLTGANGAAMPAIAAAFGRSVLRDDGGLDRSVMRRLVFVDASARVRLEAILHPMIRRESQARCEAAGAADAPYVLLVVPLLVETGGYRERVARILVVDCSEDVQISRVMARSELSASEVRAIMATQASRAERLVVADDVVLNDSGLDGLHEQLDVLHARYLKLAAASTGTEILNANR
ncbi:MAG: dephospho-CoA kinase [Propionivibrio sp.]